MNAEKNFSGKWGLYQWFEEHGTTLIHPEDIERFRALIPNGKVFECIQDDGIYLTLQYGQVTYRVLPKLFKPIAKPGKRIGDSIRLKESFAEGVVIDITWHFQRNAHMYYITINGKKKSRIYWIEDFEIG